MLFVCAQRNDHASENLAVNGPSGEVSHAMRVALLPSEEESLNFFCGIREISRSINGMLISSQSSRLEIS
jgi:hypothetical protein